MNAASGKAPEVLRGLRFEQAPLRLGRARSSVAPEPAAGAAIAPAAQEEALRQAQAQALREGHEAGVRKGREEGLREGRAEGLREGRAQAAEEIRQAVQRAVAEAELRWNTEHERLQRIAQHAHDALADLLWSAQDDMVALCYEALCRMVGDCAVQPAFVRAQLAHALERHGAAEVVLHVHPQDAELLQSAPVSVRFAVVPDPEVALGGCILKTASGALDARLETMLLACKEALLEARAGAGRQSPAGEAA